MPRVPELEHLQIPLEDIKLATDNFSDSKFIGQGGFGKVYMGQLPPSASSTTSSDMASITIAVKRLDVKNRFGQGDIEFLREIAMLAIYKHDNLASLIGFCEDGDEKIIIYKHEARGSLDNYVASTELSWMQRLHICLGTARGLNYLHTGVGDGHRVLHRDIKSANVLLNENWQARISDFGLSKIGPTNQDFTFLVTNVAGTYGYLDPLYVSTGVLTKESDVYSFGVVLFEVLCGRLAMNTTYEGEHVFLSNLAKLRYREEKLDEIILPSIREQMKSGSLQTFAAIAYQCLETDRRDRPTMGLVVQQLQLSLDIQKGFRAELWVSSTGGYPWSFYLDSNQKLRKITIFHQGLRTDQYWGSYTGGSPWSFQLDSNQKLRKITIDHDIWIYSITFTTEDVISGSLISSQRHGGTSPLLFGRISEVNFDDDEEIIGIHVTVGVSRSGHTVISSLCFITNKNMRGPFGDDTEASFLVSGDAGSFVGFYGRAGHFLDGFGCYLKPTI